MLLLLVDACKPSSNTNPAPASTPDNMIARIIHIPDSATGRPADTTVVTYNSDSSIQQMTYAAGVKSLTVFSYTPGLIRRVTSSIGAVFSIDSIVLNQEGERIATYTLVPGGPQYNYNQFFTYNGSGELVQSIRFYANNPGLKADTVTCVWQNGDMVKETFTGPPQQVVTYSYDVTKPSREGDYLVTGNHLGLGRKGKTNAHLCTGVSYSISASTRTINYSYDSQNRISGYKILEGQHQTDSTAYDFVP
jgi:hypothetical protein